MGKLKKKTFVEGRQYGKDSTQIREIRKQGLSIYRDKMAVLQSHIENNPEKDITIGNPHLPIQWVVRKIFLGSQSRLSSFIRWDTYRTSSIYGSLLVRIYSQDETYTKIRNLYKVQIFISFPTMLPFFLQKPLQRKGQIKRTLRSWKIYLQKR